MISCFPEDLSTKVEGPGVMASLHSGFDTVSGKGTRLKWAALLDTRK